MIKIRQYQHTEHLKKSRLGGIAGSLPDNAMLLGYLAFVTIYIFRSVGSNVRETGQAKDSSMRKEMRKWGSNICDIE